MAESDPNMSVQAEAAGPERRAVRRTWLVRLALLVAVGGVAWALWYALVGRNFESTDNAYVNAETAQVTPLISATVLDVKVKDTQAVKRGDVLVLLDPASAEIAVARAKAELAEARRRFRQLVATTDALSAQVHARGADISRAQAEVTAAQAEYDKARIDFSRREKLADAGAVSGEELTDARKALAGAQAALASARAGVLQARSNLGSAQGELAANRSLILGSTVETDPGVLAARARLDDAELDLRHTVIKAPVDGIISQRRVQVGQRAEQGKAIMTIVPVDKVYVDANFKEGQLKRVRVGMPATVRADIYGGGVVYHGRVAGLSGGTGASMSLIPAQNATGNWIKVAQRLPVRIELDPDELAEHPLRVGLSTEVEIDLSGN